ncbi:hypothetical protein BUALT_Bualt06G0008900 [Buddleja alternifolia]|uniref:SEC7 domain-containing protein n=1 Tax=Buddleja alternifolia TaxID=168488 RepID=A0AAV6XG65_9LAMI|nr:hypothetical protein BUALT_Bualt06G0008900 [Buddleja alternifolia]
MSGILDDAGHSFIKNFQFIDLIRAHLAYALLRASLSQSPVIFQYAAGIFSVLLLRFRDSLKAEIGVFFPLMVLRSLDGSDLNQKQSVLRMLERVCKDPQMLVDLYVNYDCDLEAPKLFERMVASLSKIAQGTQNADPKSPTASLTGSIKTSSLQALVNVLKSLVTWEKSQRVLPKQNTGKESFKEEDSQRELDESKLREDSPSNFEKLEAHKSTIEAFISEFNKHPGKGIQNLISSQVVENTPVSVAQFLRTTPNLDKAILGNYFGQHDEFPSAVMHAYVDSMNFCGMKFDSAIREFLKGFRLPGEAQKIDRIVEKFADRYYADNPGLFKNADTAYVLAYAVIILNADAHNPIASPNMSKSDFIRMNAMNDAEGSAPQELLEEIYDSIVKEEIKMKDDPAGILKNNVQNPEVEERGRVINILNLALPRKSSSTDSKSGNEAIIKQTQALIKEQGGKRGFFHTPHRLELVCPMIEAVGWPLLATFSVIMGEVDNKPRIDLCMEGFKEGIHITHLLGMDTMRYAFLTSLLRYNSLHAPRDMRGKNVEALRTLLSLCDTEINTLQDSWLAILECISRLEYAVSWPAMTITVMQGSNQVSRDAVLQSLRELAGKPTEQVFVNSIKLASESVVEFITALCTVSAEELKQTPPRVFSLQKVVEVSYYNMDRIRLVWARIWSVLAQHFIVAGSHSDEKVAIYAIDSLRQIGMKYLEHTELTNFTFQNDILKPFVVLMRNSRSETLHRLIVDGAVQMIKSKVGNIKSGWRSVFMIFTAAADDDLVSIVEKAFENVEQVILEHFNKVVGDCFMDCVNCLIGFANNKSSHGISLKAIALLRICEDRLAEGLVPGGSLNHLDTTADKTRDVTEHYWFPMLASLSDLASDPRAEVRNCALEVLFDLLNERGSKFSSSFWENIFQRVLFPIFDHVRDAEKESSISSGDEWLHESSIHSLQLLCNLFITFYKDVHFMLPQLLSLLLDCAKKTDQSVVSISLGALMHLIEIGGHQEASYTTQPLELLNDLGYESRNHHKVWTRDLDNPSPLAGHTVHETGNTMGIASPNISVDDNALDRNQETLRLPGMEGSEGAPSPSGGDIQRSQTIGQKIMGNMRDNLFTRSFTSKPKTLTSDVMVPSSPSKFSDATLEPDSRDVEENPMLENIRSKCLTQLLLIGVIDSIQKKYWDKLNTQQKLTVMEVLLSVLEFAASYNSFTNLRLRMRQIPTERPPLNLLRQELAGTSIYLDILQKTTAAANDHKEDIVKEEKLGGIAEEKLISFCEQVIKEASDFQSSMEETTNMDIHRVIELRSPIIVKVLNSMREMNSKIFRNHLRDFYPLLSKLICCEQMEVRGALADLFTMQVTTLLPVE